MKPIKLYALLDEKGKIINSHYKLEGLPFVYTSRKDAENKRRYLMRYGDDIKIYKQIKIIKLEELNE